MTDAVGLSYTSQFIAYTKIGGKPGYHPPVGLPEWSGCVDWPC